LSQNQLGQVLELLLCVLDDGIVPDEGFGMGLIAVEHAAEVDFGSVDGLAQFKSKSLLGLLGIGELALAQLLVEHDLR